MGHHVQRIGGARGEHQLVVCARSDKALERAARVLERIRGALAQRMHATVDVGPVITLEAKDNIEKHIEAMRALGNSIEQITPSGETDKGNTKEVWVYDMRANMPAFGKRTPFTRDYFRTPANAPASQPQRLPRPLRMAYIGPPACSPLSSTSR